MRSVRDAAAAAAAAFSQGNKYVLMYVCMEDAHGNRTSPILIDIRSCKGREVTSFSMEIEILVLGWEGISCMGEMGGLGHFLVTACGLVEGLLTGKLG